MPQAAALFHLHRFPDRHLWKLALLTLLRFCEMNPPGFKFELLHVDRHSGARRSRLTTPRGVIELPTFMPVGTLGTVKGLTTDQVLRTGAQILLGNTYHLALRPGADLIEELGGLHTFMDWSGPILTDSGGFQLFSLAKLANITEAGVTFRSHIDGSEMQLSPEQSVQIQQQLGSDIAMVLDHLIELPASSAEVEDANARTVRWAERCLKHHNLESQILFGIIQGGLDPVMRQQCATQLSELNFPGYAIGGLSVGESPTDMYAVIDTTTPHMPVEKPRYLMGVGKPEDLLQAIRRGVDMFDCVMPTRNGRNGMAFTDAGPLKMRNLVHRDDPNPIQPGIDSDYAHLSRAYLRHLFMAGEMLGPILLTIHNLTYYQSLMKQARQAIESDSFLDFFAERFHGWGLPSTPNGHPSG